MKSLTVEAGDERYGVLVGRLEDCRSRGGKPQAFDGELPQADLVIDALFGIGLDRAPDSEAARLISAINRHPAPRLSLDVPSGVDVARASAPGAAVRANRTIEFIAPKAHSMVAGSQCGAQAQSRHAQQLVAGGMA